VQCYSAESPGCYRVVLPVVAIWAVSVASLDYTYTCSCNHQSVETWGTVGFARADSFCPNCRTWSDGFTQKATFLRGYLLVQFRGLLRSLVNWQAQVHSTLPGCWEKHFRPCISQCCVWVQKASSSCKNLLVDCNCQYARRCLADEMMPGCYTLNADLAFMALPTQHFV